MAAQAHLVTTRFGAFYSGMLHPLTALGQLLPWLALGLLAGLQDVKVGRWVLLAFPAALLAGVSLSVAYPELIALSQVNNLSFVLLGGLVGLAWRLPTPALVALSLILGLIHGYENGLAMTAGSDPALFAVGVTVAGYVAVTLVAAFTLFLRNKVGWGGIAVRAVGSWIAAIGIMMVGLDYLPR